MAETGIAASPAKSSAATMFVVVLLALAGGGGTAWYFMQRGHAAEAAHSDPAAPRYIVHLDGFTVNLADTEEAHFLRVTLDLGIDRLPEGASKDKPAAGMPVPRIRDAVLSVLTLCKAEPLLTPEGKAQLKKNILEALQRNVPELDVRDVYFTEFLVQR